MRETSLKASESRGSQEGICQGQCQYIVIRTTTEGRKGVKDSVSMWLCVLLQVEGCQGQCACHDGGWRGGVRGGRGVKDSVGLWLCVLL